MSILIKSMKNQRVMSTCVRASLAFVAPRLKTVIMQSSVKLGRAWFILAGLLIMPAWVMAQPLPIMPPTNYNTAGLYAAGTVNTITYYSSVYGTNEQMLVYTPPNYNPNQKYGVIYAYQGIGAGIDTIFDDWCVYAGVVADNLIGQGKIKPVIIVAVNDQINGSPSADTINCVIPFIDSNYSTYADADHRGVYGYSWGGMYCADVGSANLSTFHHLSPSSPAFFSSGQGPGLFPNGYIQQAEKPAAFLRDLGLGRLLPSQPGFGKLLRFQQYSAWLAARSGGGPRCRGVESCHVELSPNGRCGRNFDASLSAFGLFTVRGG